MSPEVAKDQPYNLSVDCYSFGVLFWQICSLQTPYAGYSQQTHAEKVVRNGQRPKADKSWPGSWTNLMVTAWSANPAERPTMTMIANALDEMVHELAEEDGVVPSRASEIRAKKKRKKVSRENHATLDVDTRITTTNAIGAAGGIKRHDADIV